MSSTVPARGGQHVPFSAEPSVLLVTRDSKIDAIFARRRYAATLVRMQLSAEFGVFVAPAGRGVYGVFIGRHDGRPVAPTAAALARRWPA